MSEHHSLQFPENLPIIDSTPVNCGVCGANDCEYFASSYDFEYETCGNRWTFVRCRRCENVYLNPRPLVKDLNVIYPSNYYSYGYESTVNKLAWKVKAVLDRLTFKKIIDILGYPPRSYLDIGCGSGRYLRLINGLGVGKEKVFGLELDGPAAKRLKDEGFMVEKERIEDAELPENFFDLVTLFSVIEHVESPKACLEKIYKILAPGGVVCFEAPNIKSLNASLFRDYHWGGYHTPRHWNLFSLDTITKVARPMGYEFAGLKRSTGHAFWLWSFHHYVKYQLGFKKLGELLNPSKCLPLVAVATLVDTIRAKLGQETDNSIIFLRKPRTA